MIKKINLSGHANQELENMGFEFPGALHVNLADPTLPEKVAQFLQEKCQIDSGDTVWIAIPGLSALSVIAVTAIHGLTGHFPVLVPLVRGEKGFTPADPLNLQDYRNEIARQQRENVVKL